MMFVGPGWMNKMGRWSSHMNFFTNLTADGCAYYGKLKKEGQAYRYDDV